MTMTDDIADRSLTTVASMIAKKQLSAVEVTRCCVERIEAYGEAHRCIAHFDAESALAAAAAADTDLMAGRVRGPLHGVPLAHKDMFYRAGRVSGCGSRIRAAFTPDHTATVLARLDKAGALDIARLSMVEFALGLTGHNVITGTPRNPWNLEHITGGLLERAGGRRGGAPCLRGLGIRYGRFNPHSCRLLRFGRHKTELWSGQPVRISWAWRFPWITPGPLARTVADCALLLQIISGHDANDATTSRPVRPRLYGGDRARNSWNADRCTRKLLLRPGRSGNTRAA